jgi:glycosyltransferase involved in cell wall biosynthesis
MRIAMIGQKGIPAIFGGVERHVHELSVRLVRRGHDVTVYSRHWYVHENKADSFAGVKIKKVKSIHTKHLDTITHVFLSTIHAIGQKYDVIHYHGVGPALLSWMPRVFSPQTKVINTFHSIDRKHEKWGLFARLVLKMGERATCSFAHQTIAVSRTIQKYVRDVYDVDVSYIPNGVPVYTKSKKKDKLNQWNLKSKSYILVVTRLIPHKGVHYAIAAYKKLLHANPKVVGNKKLVIVGDGYYTEEYVSYLKKMAGGEKKIVFTGFQTKENLRQLFSNALLMIHPSNNEGLPITVLEGMSYGLPILVSDITEHRELIPEPEYNFTHGDAESLKTHLEKILKRSSATLMSRGKKNKQSITRDFEWKNIVDETEELYASPRNNETLKIPAAA